MTIDLSTELAAKIEADWLVVPCCEDGPADGRVDGIDAVLGGVVSRLRQSGDFTGKAGELSRLLDTPQIAARRLMLVGLGPTADLKPAGLRRALQAAVREICTRPERSLVLALPGEGETPAMDLGEFARIAAAAVQVGGASQQLYRGKPERHPLAGAYFAVDSADAQRLRTAIDIGTIEGEAVNLTRELVNRHPGEIYPETFAARAAQEAAAAGVDCEIYDEPKLRQERMGALLAVARGSVRPPRMVVLNYRGGADDAPTLGFVGKGVTFDSGGLSLKPSDSMKSMKADMAGAASVLGAMTAIARLKLPLNVRGFMGLVENMPSGSAYMLGEILTARNGVTIEVHNTDAEGRLVLADVLSFAVDSGVDRIVDLATLTGSCVVALGEFVTGVFSNNDDWCDALLAAAGAAGEDVWRLPMFDSYAEQLKSETADCKNVGTRWGGSITAAKFLEKFVSNVPWVHLDIAGPAFAESNQPYQDGGGTGAMVRTLIELADAESRPGS